MRYSEKRKVKLTSHAKQRMEERLPHIQKRDYEKFVQGARYKGLSVDDPKLDDKIRRFVSSHYRTNNSGQMIVYRGYIFIFCGDGHHARTLRTVNKLPEWVMKEGKLVENICNR